MDVTEKNGQPSMEEILASIRRIIAEEPLGVFPAGIDLNMPGHHTAPHQGDGVLDDHSDFDLPSIFRPASNSAPEKHTPLLGRLTDAIRGAAGAAAGEARTVRPLEEHATDGGSQNGALNGDSLRHAQPVLSTLKTARLDAQVVEFRPQEPVPQPAPMPASAPLAASPGSDDVKRVMAPFKDTRFKMMSHPAAAEDTASSAPQAKAPAHASGRIDFTTIIPGHMDMPGADPLRRPEAAPAYEQSYPAKVSEPAAAMPDPFAQLVEQSVFVAPGPNSPFFAGLAPSERPVPAAPAEAFGIRQPDVYAQPGPLHSVPDTASFRLVSGPPEAHPVSQIEDTTADLLRPMLRQWLADNMPRMVEKALHIEVAESLKTGKKPSGQ